MCGIAGIINFKATAIPMATIQQFTDSMVHRGPDSGDYVLLHNETVALGHRRLSILDLSAAGCQPMQYADGRYTMVYNGEVFNFLELRVELEKAGYGFRTNTDTEVILAAYDHWGKDCLYHFNGMWAIGIWDDVEKEFWLARDRFGIKPLYFSHQENEQFTFASETNAFQYLEGFERRFNEKYVSLSLQDPYSLEGFGKTIFDQIDSLLPGHWISIKGHQITTKKWWQTADHLQKVPAAYEAQVEQFKNLFADACKLRLRSDVPIGTALSGGLDSSAVYCMLHHLKNQDFITDRLPAQWQKAFSAIFPGTEQDEQAYAQQVVDFVGGEVSWIEQSPYSLADKIISSTRELDVIYNTPLFIGSDIYGGMKQRGVTVSMDGHGVDEMLYGYGFAVKKLADETAYKDVTLAENYWQVYEEMYAERPIKPAHFEEQLLVQSKLKWKIKKDLKKIAGRTVVPSFNEAILYNQFHLSMLPTILRNFDKMAMQHSIEIRMPFMDWRLVTFVFSLPDSSKVGNGYTKRILRDAMKGLMPEPVRIRKLKTGLNAPMQSWFAHELKPFVLDYVNSVSFQQSNLWDGKHWAKLAEDRSSKNTWTFNEALAFWPLLNASLLMH